MKKTSPNFYKNLVSEAWQITKQHKFLWFFGFFSAILVGAAGEFNVLIKNIENIANKSGAFWGIENSIFSPDRLTDIYYRFISLSEWMGAGWFWSVLAIFILLGLYALYAVLISEPAIVYAANKYDGKVRVSFSKTLVEGKKYLWPSLILNFIAKILVWLVFFGVEVLLGYLFLKTDVYAWVVLYMVISFVILLPIAIIISFVTKYALAYVVLQKEKTWPAFVKAWKLFFKNWLVSLEQALIIFVLYFLIGLALFVALAIITVPLFVLMAVGITSGAPMLAWFVFILDIIVFFLAIIWVGSMMAAWQLISWILLFDHLTKGRAESSILKAATKLAEKRPFTKKL